MNGTQPDGRRMRRPYRSARGNWGAWWFPVEGSFVNDRAADEGHGSGPPVALEKASPDSDSYAVCDSSASRSTM